jgi:hypothetical protein
MGACLQGIKTDNAHNATANCKGPLHSPDSNMYAITPMDQTSHLASSVADNIQC